MPATTASVSSPTVVTGTSTTARPRWYERGLVASPGCIAMYETRPRPASSSTSTINTTAADSSTPVCCRSHQACSRHAASGAANWSSYIGGTSTGRSAPDSASRDLMPTATELAS
ncbi:hypothetical protein ITI46_00515 [Streptomyces oryzae]|uniref:Uncharacterized protein n=1 Tax=Streptomyces oryzae TaxID=1434886 RepID=A0ABS3X4A1_9ACTN|nr:hypothetical protein [Streptomyces oryzae]MBO8190208.1 hypothetical protein [Streptomyces oryzae]